MASIELKNISKVYEGGVQAVSHLDLQIAHGEFIVLVGPSGCGKSTVLRMIAGLEDVTEGELYIGERMVNEVLPKDRDIAMVFQNYALYPHMTVYKNMAFGLENRKMPKTEIDTRVREVAAMLGIEDLLKRKPKAMSGGQRQRVALGRAMVRDPAVFLLDEPLSNLDAKLRASTRMEISKLHRKLDATFVYVTHDQIEAMTMGDRIVVMKDGVAQQTDTPQNIYEHPANLFVAGFIGTPPMNFLPAIVGRDEQSCFLQFREAEVHVSGAEEQLIPYLGRQVVMGVRPDHVLLREGGALSAQVEAIESLGGETYLYLECSGERITIKAQGIVTVRPGENIPVWFDAERINVFDAETENAII